MLKIHPGYTISPSHNWTKTDFTKWPNTCRNRRMISGTNFWVKEQKGNIFFSRNLLQKTLANANFCLSDCYCLTVESESGIKKNWLTHNRLKVACYHQCNYFFVSQVLIPILIKIQPQGLVGTWQLGTKSWKWTIGHQELETDTLASRVKNTKFLTNIIKGTVWHQTFTMIRLNIEQLTDHFCQHLDHRLSCLDDLGVCFVC